MKKTKVVVCNYGKSLNRALHLIDKFKLKNNLDFPLEIGFDLSEVDQGYFFYNDKNSNILFINPCNCESNGKRNKTLGHCLDSSVYAVVIHEFCHFLDKKMNLLEEYRLMHFAIHGPQLTPHSKNDIIEELAEIMCLYLINPYSLKIIDLERYKWLKSKFKTPTVCSSKKFIKYFTNWPKKHKKKFSDKYKIEVCDEFIKLK